MSLPTRCDQHPFSSSAAVHYGAYVRTFVGPELLSFNKIALALCLVMRICQYSFGTDNVAEIVSIVNKSTGLRHVFLGNIFWYAKENTAYISAKQFLLFFEIFYC